MYSDRLYCVELMVFILICSNINVVRRCKHSLLDEHPDLSFNRFYNQRGIVSLATLFSPAHCITATSARNQSGESDNIDQSGNCIGVQIDG